jgi:hypothetical protein
MTRLHNLKWSLSLLCVGLVLMCLGACTTVTPPSVQATEIAFDGGAQTAGVIGTDDTGAIISPAKRAYCNSLAAIYGDAKWAKGGLPIFPVPVGKDDGITQRGDKFHITYEALTRHTLMHQWFKKGRMPQ